MAPNLEVEGEVVLDSRASQDDGDHHVLVNDISVVRSIPAVIRAAHAVGQTNQTPAKCHVAC